MKNIGSYPSIRLRRNRKTEWSRRLVGENNLSTNDLIWPIFIRDGKNIKEPVKTMPGIYRYTIDKIENLVEKAINKKIPMIALFPNILGVAVIYKRFFAFIKLFFDLVK